MTEDGNVVDLNTEILIKIHDEIRQVRSRMETLETETIRGFTAVRGELTQVNERLDRYFGVSSDAHRALESRVAALEGDVKRIKSAKGSTRRRPGPPKR